MKKFLSLFLILGVFFGCTFAITQTVNETNGINYGYIKSISNIGTKYYLSIDYIQYYQWYEAAVARAGDGIIFGDLSIDFNQNYPASYYTTNTAGERIATKAIRKTITKYLVKNGSKKFDSLIKKITNYTGTNISTIFNGLTETERMIVWASFSPAKWRWVEYIRNTNDKLRKIQFSPTTKITIDTGTLTLSQLVTWAQPATKALVKVFLTKGKIEWFRLINMIETTGNTPSTVQTWYKNTTYGLSFQYPASRESTTQEVNDTWNCSMKQSITLADKSKPLVCFDAGCEPTIQPSIGIYIWKTTDCSFISSTCNRLGTTLKGVCNQLKNLWISEENAARTVSFAGSNGFDFRIIKGAYGYILKESFIDWIVTTTRAFLIEKSWYDVQIIDWEWMYGDVFDTFIKSFKYN